MADTLGSLTVNGQMTPVYPGIAFVPASAPGPSLRGAARPAATIPSGVGSQIGYGGSTAVSGAAASPGSPSRSPIPLLIASLIGGLLILRYVHWRRD